MIAQFEIDPLLIMDALTAAEAQGHSSSTRNGDELQLLVGQEPDRRRPVLNLRPANPYPVPEPLQRALLHNIPLEQTEEEVFHSIQFMTDTFGVSEATLYGWARRGIIGKKSVPANPQSAWLVSEQDALIINLILQRSIQSSFEAKAAIAEAIRNGRSPEQALEASKKIKKTNVHVSQKAKEELLRFTNELQEAIEENQLREPPEPLCLYRLVRRIRGVLPAAPCVFTLDRFIKIAYILGESTSLPSNEAMVNSQRGWRYALTLEGLMTTLQVAQDVLAPENLSVETAYQQAVQELERRRKERVAIDKMVLPVLNAQGYSEPTPTRQLNTKSLLTRLIREKDEEKRLPLPADLPLRECLLYGIPLEQTGTIAMDWARLIQQSQRKPEKEPTIKERLNVWLPLSHIIRTNLPTGTRVDLRTVPYAAAWMKAKGVPVETISRKQDDRIAFYYRLPPEEKMSAEERELLEAVFTDPEKRAALTRVLNQGLSLEEILALKEYFPDQFSFSVTHAYWLATGGRGRLVGERKASALKALEKSKEVTVIKKTTSSGKTIHHLPLNQLEKAVAVLKSL